MDLLPLKALMAERPGVGLAVAESLTSGGVQARIGAVSGASAFFRGGITTYTLEQKVAHLGVDQAEAAACNCVSEPVARQMARGCAAMFSARIALATTGYAEPWPDEGIEEPFAWWALAAQRASGGWDELTGRVDGAGFDRGAMQAAVSEAVLAALIDYLQAGRDQR